MVGVACLHILNAYRCRESGWAALNCPFEYSLRLSPYILPYTWKYYVLMMLYFTILLEDMLCDPIKHPQGVVERKRAACLPQLKVLTY